MENQYLPRPEEFNIQKELFETRITISHIMKSKYNNPIDDRFKKPQDNIKII